MCLCMFYWFLVCLVDWLVGLLCSFIFTKIEREEERKRTIDSI